MKRLSDGGKSVVLVPLVLEPIEVEVPLAGVTPEIRDVAIAIAVLSDRLCNISSMPLPFECSQGCILFGTLKVR